jgi:hypothetical protein
MEKSSFKIFDDVVILTDKKKLIGTITQIRPRGVYKYTVTTVNGVVHNVNSEILRHIKESDLVESKKPSRKKDTPNRLVLSAINGAIRDFWGDLHSQQANNSCGIREVDGVENSFNQLINSYDYFTGPEGFYIARASYNKLLIDTFKNNFSKDINDFKDKYWIAAFLMFSITDDSDYDVLHKLLDKYCDSYSSWVRNPNSGNNIKIWIF